MSWSPDGKSIVFVAKSKGKESIMLLDVKDGNIYKKIRLDYYNILNPAWSPDGKLIAFSALAGHKRDLYTYNLETEKIDQITDDRYDDVEASWMPDSRWTPKYCRACLTERFFKLQGKGRSGRHGQNW